VTLSPEERYSAREQRFRAEGSALERRSRAFSRARLIVFLVGAALLGGALAQETFRFALLAGAGVAAISFFVLVARHQQVEDRLSEQQTIAAVNREALARVRRDWGAIPAVTGGPPPENHPFAGDLDVFGHASLLQLLGAVGTREGIKTLRNWMLAPASRPVIGARQAAVAELAGRLDMRHELLARALQATRGRGGAHEEGLEHFFEWAEGHTWLLSRPWLLWLARLLSGVAVLLILLQIVDWIPGPLWLAPALANVVLWFLLVRRIEHTFNRAFARDSAPGREAQMFEVVERQAFTSDLLGQLGERTRGASRAMQRLQRLMELADIRFTTLVHFPLNAVTLWDFHVLAAVEHWQVACGRHARDWFQAIGEVEALSALAGLRDDNPGWAFPTFTDDPVIEAVGLGHPLLPERTRVVNDVKVGPPGTFLFVTGSNMSGKSTLLRAIGVNAVLALAGAPVCANSMRMARVTVATSMRVQDSLESGVSYFLAALQRLKQILEDASRPGADDAPELYLLDEILQGTNTAERQIAVRMILSELLRRRAIGAVTSHDLNLADEEPLASAAEAVHFEEHFEGDTMTFDYRLRPGVATSRNALKLMKMMGLAPAQEAREPAAER
jgi:ABC-type multidrug transport system fused ATPase/permease subunit